jgi:hypothetical protein
MKYELFKMKIYQCNVFRDAKFLTTHFYLHTVYVERLHIGARVGGANLCEDINC